MDNRSQFLEKLKTYLPPHLAQRISVHLSTEDATAILVHVTLLRYVLSTYLPRSLLESIAEDPTPGRVRGGFQRGTVMLADVSGFTAMSERLSALGREGAEEVTKIVNDFFETMLTISASYGGDLLKFGGDALLLFFAGERAAIRSIAAAHTMQQAMSRFARLRTSQGVFPLQMSIGVGSGPVFLASLGSLDRMEFAVVGPALVSMAKAEVRSNAGQVITDQVTRDALVGEATFTPTDDGFYRLNRLIREETQQNHFSQEVEPPLFVTGTDVADLLEQCRAQLATIGALQPFLPDDLLAYLIRDPQQLSLPGSHRPVTVMFANFYGIDRIIERLGPEHEGAITQILDHHFCTMSRILDRYGGVVNKVNSYAVGHQVMALFGALRAHEDDPERAVRAALDMNLAMAQVNEHALAVLGAIPGHKIEFGTPLLKQRIGMNSGFVFAGQVGSSARREYSVMGDEVNLTFRLMGVSQPGQVLISHNTARYLNDRFALSEQPAVKVKGKANPVRNFVVTGMLDYPLLPSSETTGPMVGRDRELNLARETVDRARSGEGRLLVVTGQLGIGKTRMVDEILSHAQSEGMHVLAGACLSYGGRLTYHPWGEVLRTYFGFKPSDNQFARAQALERRLKAVDEAGWAPVVADVLGLDIPDNELTVALDAKLRRQRLFDLTLKLLQTRAQHHPLILIIEDIHWADPASMELIKYLARNIASHPILFVMSHRPEDDLPDWSSLPHAVYLALGDLPQDACHEVIRGLLGPAGLPVTLRETIVRKSAGNPLFIEHMVRALVDGGTLQRGPSGTWRLARDVASVELPDTIYGIIISRIDRLPQAERLVLQVASVVGSVFDGDVLDNLTPYDDLEGPLPEQLANLVRLGLIEPYSPEEDTYRFRHLTTREVIYDSLAFDQRRGLHRRIAAHIEQVHPHAMAEHIDLMAHHYFQGHNWAKAMEYNLLTARRTQREFANEGSVAAYQRVLNAASELDRDTLVERLLAHESLGEVLALLGQYEEALHHYAQGRQMVEAEAPSPDQKRHLADLCRKTAFVYERRSQYPDALKWLNHGLERLGARQPTLEAAQIYLLGAGVYRRQGKYDDAVDWCLRSLRSASDLATREGHQAVAQACYNLAGIYTTYGDYAQAVQFCEQSIRFYQEVEDVIGESNAYVNLANVYSDQGDWSQASSALGKSLAIKRRVGDIFGQGMIANNLANIMLYRGQWDVAANLLEESLGIWRQVGAAWGEAIVLSNLAQVRIYQQNWDEAERCLSHSQAIFDEIGSEDFLPELERRWGELYLNTNALEKASAHTARSIDLALAQNARLEEGMSRRLLGRVLQAQGEIRQAQAELERSMAILQDLNSQYEAARTHLYLIRLEAEAGPTPETRAQLEAIIQTFEGLGAQADLADALALEAQLSFLSS